MKRLNIAHRKINITKRNDGQLLIGFFMVLLIIMILLLLNILFKNTNYYMNSIDQLQKIIKGVPDNLEIINLGSSYGKYAFCYDHIKIKGFNFAIKPQSLSYDFKILQQYRKNLNEGCIVLISLVPLVFCLPDTK